ncbi:Beta-1,3-glucan-binding protein [Holothuria leucospilota]|uniref:Beta-1,3-glucan-binding protein n=1 Tax=Holothuria leucospilota TaxID=206669 RepID=A0A9Q0YGH0_HOLLE|nr:Beta-1,3-glucan-binding protein [Holothuria leucospilota]
MYKKLLLALFALCACAYDIGDVDISLLNDEEPIGVKFALADDPGITLVAYHYSVNKAIDGVAAGDYNVDVTTAIDGFWVHENPYLNVYNGDTIYYWIHVIYRGQGFNGLDLYWTASEPAVTQVPTTTTTPTTATTQTSTPTTVSSTPTSATTTTQGPPGATVPQAAVVFLTASLIFEDTFDTFDLDTWQHEITAGGGGNWEFQYYTNNRSNSFVRDNVLYIKPTLTSDKEGEAFLTSGTLSLWGASPADLCTGNNWYGCERSGSYSNIINPIQSARLRTVESFAFKYGKIEVEAQMPKGDWIWPAIWLLPKRNAYGQWPASGEIDLVETRGNLNLYDGQGTHVGINQMGQTLHWGPYWPLNGWQQTHTSVNLPSGTTFGDDFHKYGLEWTTDSLTFYLNDVETLKVDPGVNGFWDYGGFSADNPGIDNPWVNSTNKLAPFDQEFYIILNVAVGGTGYFSDTFTNSPHPKPWLNTSPTAAKDFWNARDIWYPTWNPDTNNGEDAAMKVRSVRVWAA